MPDSSALCSYCENPFSVWSSQCPHCARPSLFPNVAIASDEELDLEARYQATLESLADCAAVGRRLEELPTQAVITRAFHESFRLATKDTELYGTYYNAIDGGFRVPEGNAFDVWRSVADAALFPTFYKEIRFGCLSAGPKGLWWYGDVAWVLRDEMIAHRASVFEENSVYWMKKLGTCFNEMPALPRGYRATWKQRGRLCVAKLGSQLQTDHTDAGLAELLHANGGHPDKDTFVEVHIYGSISIRTIRKMELKPGVAQSQGLVKTLGLYSKRFGVEFAG